MAENDFLPFATGSAANVLTQAEFAAMTALASGFTSGVAKSAAVNKVLRQSSIMAAVLAAFIVDNADVDVVDDGTTATIEANFLAALKAKLASLNGSASNRFSVADAVAGTDAVNLETAEELFAPVNGSTENRFSVAKAAAPTDVPQLQQIGHGQCRLLYVSATTLTLTPYDGNNVLVDGVPLQLPAAGVSVSNAGVAASTYYYAYLSGTTAAPVLALSPTPYVTGSNGVKVKSGDSTQTYVGAVATNASSQFSDSANARLVISHFNKRDRHLAQAVSGITFTNTTNAEVTTGIRAQFISEADDSVFQWCDGEVAANTNGTSLLYQAAIDGASGALGSYSGAYLGSANSGLPLVTNNTTGVAEGQVHFMTLLASVNQGTGTILQGYVRGKIRG